MWIGVALQKNGLGRLCILSLFFILWTWVKRRQKHAPPVGKTLLLTEIFLTAMTVYLMRGPGGKVYSATAIGALAAGLLVYSGLLFLRKRSRPIGSFVLMALVALIIMGGVVSVFTQGSAVGSMASTFGRDSSLTDRTVVWKALVPVAMRHPILGNGFGSFWVPRTREYFKISEGHSGYLDVLLELGFVGIVLVSIFLLSSCQKAHREMSRDYDWAVLWICCLIMSVVHNITESSIQTFTSPLTAILLFLTVSSTSPADRLEGTPEKIGLDENEVKVSSVGS
jgi:O-antigen ligase